MIALGPAIIEQAGGDFYFLPERLRGNVCRAGEGREIDWPHRCLLVKLLLLALIFFATINSNNLNPYARLFNADLRGK